MSDETAHPSPPPLPPPPPSLPRWRWAVHLVLITGYLVWSGVGGFLGDPAGGPALSSHVGGLLQTSAVTLAIFGIVFGLAWLASRASRDALLLRWRQGFWPVPLGIGYSVALRIAVGLVAVLVAGVLVASGVFSTEELQSVAQESRPNVEAVVDVTSLRDDPVYLWLMITLVSFVVAGLREELWRSAFLAGLGGLWPETFGSRRGQIVGVVLGAVLFGFAHAVQGPVACVLTGLLGLGLGLIMVLHRSIWPAVLAHGFFDATSFALIPTVLQKLQEWQQTLQP